MFYKVIIFAVSFAFLPQSFASTYPMQEYELVVVESLPEELNLGMNLSQIYKAKRNSRIGKTKTRVYEVVRENLLKSLQKALSKSEYSLLGLAKKVAVDQIIDQVMKIENGNTDSPTPADFLVLVLPKVPKSQIKNRQLPYAPLYSQKKATVIDGKGSHDAQLGLSFDDKINQRIQNALNLVYRRNYVKLSSKSAFFVGAALHIHIEGKKSWVKTQIVGSLPTDFDQAFEQKSPQAHIKMLRSPRTPSQNDLRKNKYPGVIISFMHKPNVPYGDRLNMHLQFGNLGRLKNNQWHITDPLKNFDDQWQIAENTGIASMSHNFNTPHLFGVPKAVSPNGYANAFVSSQHDLQVNIHEVAINLDRLEITKVRSTIELPKKTDHTAKTIRAALPLAWQFYEVPAIEQPEGVSKEIMDSGNAELNKVRSQLEPIINSGLMNSLQGSDSPGKLLEAISALLVSKTAGANQ